MQASSTHYKYCDDGGVILDPWRPTVECARSFHSKIRLDIAGHVPLTHGDHRKARGLEYCSNFEVGGVAQNLLMKNCVGRVRGGGDLEIAGRRAGCSGTSRAVRHTVRSNPSGTAHLWRERSTAIPLEADVYQDAHKS